MINQTDKKNHKESLCKVLVNFPTLDSLVITIHKSTQLTAVQQVLSQNVSFSTNYVLSL